MVDHIDFLALYQELFNIIPQGDFQLLMDTASKILDVPILVVDITYHVLGIAPKVQTGDANWDYLLEHRCFDTDHMLQLYKEGIMQSANTETKPYIINWGSYNEKFPKVQGFMRINDILEGYVTMLFQSNDIPNDYLKAMEIIASSCEIMFKHLDSQSSMLLTHQKAFANELFNGRILSSKQLQAWLRDTHLDIAPPYRILAITTYDGLERNTLSYIQKVISQKLVHQIALIQHNVLYILQCNCDTLINEKDIEKTAHTLFNQFNAFCGISNAFDNLLQITDYQTQAQDAMHFGSQTHSKYHLYFYEDFYLPAILAPRIDQMPIVNYISPIIVTIREYDQLHGSDLLNTLNIYIKNLCNPAETISKLHIHRNSLLYRINKIEELTNASLKDYTTFMHLLISFYMLEYQEMTR